MAGGPSRAPGARGVRPMLRSLRSRRLVRSRLFWRMMSGAFVASLAMLLTAALSVTVINHLVEETALMHTAFAAAAPVDSFADALDSVYGALDLLNRPGYQANPYLIARQSLDAHRQELRAVTLDGPDRATLDSLLARFDGLDPLLQQLNTQGMGDPTGARARWDGPPADVAARLRELRSTARNLATALNVESSASLSAITDLQRTALLGIAAIGLAGLVLGLLLSLMILRGTARRLIAITGDIERLAGGDLRPPPRLRRANLERAYLTDEVAALEAAYLTAIRTLGAPLQRIQDDAARISASSAEISQAATYQAAGSSQQATAITEVTVTVEELSQTAVQIAEAAGSVAGAAEQALVSASGGQEAVRDSIIGMTMIRSRVNDITARILALSTQSQRISEIIDVIDDMAARTHILALNAAVESAGAGGEVGERFGVVASEVKKLAQRSAVATREVRTIIGQVQAATNAAVMATEDGLKETEKGVELAHQSGDANEDIIQMVERTAQLAQAISLATQQQRTASEQVVATMREIAQVTRQAAASSRQASDAATELSEIAHELDTVSDRFRIEYVPRSPTGADGRGDAPAAWPAARERAR